MDRTGKYIDGTRQEKSRFGEPECGQTGGKNKGFPWPPEKKRNIFWFYVLQ